MPIVDGINYDKYGGYADLDLAALGGTVLRGVPGRWRTGLVNNRACFVDPDGKLALLKGFYKAQLYTAHFDFGGGGYPPMTQQQHVLAKYTTVAGWYKAVARKCRTFYHANVLGHGSDFNFMGEATSSDAWYDEPFWDGSPNPGPPWRNPYRMNAFALLDRKTVYAMNYLGPGDAGYSPSGPYSVWDALGRPGQPIKNFVALNQTIINTVGFPISGSGGAGQGVLDAAGYLRMPNLNKYILFPDVFDPALVDFLNHPTTREASSAFYFNSPWVIGVGMDNTDELHGLHSVHPNENGGFNASPSVTSIDFSLGWLALCSCDPIPRNGGTETTTAGKLYTFTDTTNYTKWELRNFLFARYGGSIANLNASWNFGWTGSPVNYTTFDHQGSGWRLGTGLLDEDGRNPWVNQFGARPDGGEPNWRRGVDSTQWPPNIRQDLNDFTYEIAKKYFTVCRDAIKLTAPDTLYYGPTFIGANNGVPHPAVMRAAGEICDFAIIAGMPVFRPRDENIGRIEAMVAGFVTPAPVVSAIYYPVNVDSSMWNAAVYKMSVTPQSGALDATWNTGRDVTLTSGAISIPYDWSPTTSDQFSAALNKTVRVNHGTFSSITVVYAYYIDRATLDARERLFQLTPGTTITLTQDADPTKVMTFLVTAVGLQNSDHGATQEGRGNAIKAVYDQYATAKSWTTGRKPFGGFLQWEWGDNRQESSGWGPNSMRDNIYDAHSAAGEYRNQTILDPYGSGRQTRAEDDTALPGKLGYGDVATGIIAGATGLYRRLRQDVGLEAPDPPAFAVASYRPLTTVVGGANAFNLVPGYQGATVEVFLDGVTAGTTVVVNGDEPSPPTTRGNWRHIVPPLLAGQRVTATQRLGVLTSAPSLETPCSLDGSDRTKSDPFDGPQNTFWQSPSPSTLPWTILQGLANPARFISNTLYTVNGTWLARCNQAMTYDDGISGGDHDVSVQVVAPAGVGLMQVGVIARKDMTATLTFYRFRHSTTGTWVVERLVNNVATQLGTGTAAALANGQTPLLSVLTDLLTGDTIVEAKLSGVTVFGPVVDPTPIPRAAGLHGGLYVQALPTSNIQVNFYQQIARPPAPAAPVISGGSIGQTTIQGTGLPGCRVTAFVNALAAGTDIVRVNGTWTVPIAPLASGSALTASQFDGLESALSAVVDVTSVRRRRGKVRPVDA